MKLLFDHNLSYKLVGRLADLFPDSEHVRNVNLHEADGRTVWEYARANGLAIVSQGEDFHQRSFLYGAPPKAEPCPQPVKTWPQAIAYSHSIRWS